MWNLPGQSPIFDARVESIISIPGAKLARRSCRILCAAPHTSTTLRPELNGEQASLAGAVRLV